MSYDPTNWKTGDVVTSAKLNKLEQGVAGACGVLIVTDTDGTLDKTWQEIYDAQFAVIKKDDDGERYAYPVIGVYEDSGEYIAAATGGAGRVISYSSSSASGFPAIGGGGGGGD